MKNLFNLPEHKTKIVCTIGPATNNPRMIENLIDAGMNVARINFSHDSYETAKTTIDMIKAASRKVGRTVEILIDLPGAKIRVGILTSPMLLKKGQRVILSTQAVKRPEKNIIPVDYKQLYRSVTKGNVIFLSDGFIQLRVLAIKGHQVECVVTMGGELRSHKGLNLPGAKLFVKPVTARDMKIIRWGMSIGITTFALSFIEKASDIRNVRSAIGRQGKKINLVAKIERQEAINNFDAILDEADVIMVARGDMGVEIPVEEVPLVQKKLIEKANNAGVPIIIATQMLMSMTQNIRPTRAEVNDVANAILDGTDAVMLSEETAVGQYPIEVVHMIRQIAITTEAQYQDILGAQDHQQRRFVNLEQGLEVQDVISRSVVRAVSKIKAKYILTPTHSGNTVRHVSRFKPACWILAFTPNLFTCNFLMFSYGVHPFLVAGDKSLLPREMVKYIKVHGLIKSKERVVVTQRQFSNKPGETDVMGIITI